MKRLRELRHEELFFHVLNTGQYFYLRQSFPIVSLTYITSECNKKVLVGCDACLRPERECSQLLLQIWRESFNIKFSTLNWEAWTPTQGNLEVLHRARLRLPSRNAFWVKYFCKLPYKMLLEWSNEGVMMSRELSTHRKWNLLRLNEQKYWVLLLVEDKYQVLHFVDRASCNDSW